jgi:hypothetical protein
MVNDADYPETEWRKVTIDKITFRIPKTFTQRNTKCFESRCYVFEDAESVLTIDLTSYAFRPSFQRYSSGYEEKTGCIGSIPVWIWHFPYDETGFKFSSGAFFYPKTKAIYTFGFSLLSKSNADLSEKIFLSVQVNE